MRVLGFDPGTATTGYGVVEGQGTRLRYIAHGVITTPAHTHFASRLRSIHDEVVRLIAVHRPEAVSIERLYFTRNVTMGLTIAQSRGVIALAAECAGLPIAEFSPLEVKNAVVGYGKATKQQVQEMVKILLNLEARPKPDDAADALALAICHVQAGRAMRVLRH